MPQKPLCILFVSHHGGMAGAQQTLLTLLEGLDRNIFTPYLVVPSRGELAERVSKLGIPVTVCQLLHWVPCLTDVPQKRRWRHLWKVLRTMHWRVQPLSSLIEHLKIDLVYTNTVTCVEGVLAAKITNRQHIWHIHEPIHSNSELLPLLPLWLYSTAIRILSSRIVFPSSALSSNYSALQGKASVVHNGLSIPPMMDRVAARAEVTTLLGLDTSRILVAVIGAIQPRKDHHTFLKAAKIVLANLDNVDFLIVGSGKDFYTQQICDFAQTLGIANRVILTGRWTGAIHTMMAAIDVLVISSEQESFGLTAIESLAMETPVVSTRCGGPEEIIQDGVNGFLVNTKDDTAMAEAILKLLNDPILARNMGVAGRLDVLKRFTLERYINGIQDVMLATCERPPNTTNPDLAGKNPI
ncbi:MAG: glycosyltransferase family 4 protein [Sulfuriferula sp.]